MKNPTIIKLLSGIVNIFTCTLATIIVSRSMDFHVHSMTTSGETAIAGVTLGLIGMGQEVTWRARHFGMSHEHTAKITMFDRPKHFRDEMIHGRFKRFVHDHHFEATPAGTLMRDVLDFNSPLGFLGAAVDSFILNRYLVRLLQTRNQVVQRAAESR